MATATHLFHPYFCFIVLIVVLVAQTKASGDLADTILVGAPLTGADTRISSNGMFQLGFFNLQNTSKWYVGIWYAKASQQTIAWIANRDKPLQNASGIFNLTEEGSLVLAYGNSVIWSTDSTQRASSAAIRDTGNLVVMSARNSSEIIWQSFDHPGNTWLPEMKISVSQKLTSWKSRWDPTPGLFSLQMDPSGADQFVLLWNNSVQYWASGVWNGKQFTNVPEMTQNYIFNFNFSDIGADKYFTYTYSVNPAMKSAFLFVMSSAGSIEMSFLGNDEKTWNIFWSKPVFQCDVYALCGAYGSCKRNNVETCNCVHGFAPKEIPAWNSREWSAGCVRQTPLQCFDSKADGFVELTGKSIPSGELSNRVESSSMESCKEACQENCSCTAYAHITNGAAPACQLWFGELLNLYDDTSSSISLFLRLAASDVPKSSSTRKKIAVVGAVVGVVGGLATISVVVLMLVIWYRRRRLHIKSKKYGSSSLIIFSYKELQRATLNFSERLGQEAFDSVFKGTLPDKSLVAVKKLESVSDGQGEKEFRTEVSTIGAIQHVNLVRLRGFCADGPNRFLVYDFMPKGSLNTLLFHKRQGGEENLKVLDWKTRLRIALGTARGLLYLHEECRDCIIHCDIKPENILLDYDFCPKVAHFGLAKIMGREFSRVLTTMRGTRGYLAPEWISGVPITAKADVYSFGMTLLEIVSGRRTMDVDPEDSEFFFPAWAASEINKGNIVAVLDKKLENCADPEELRRAAMVAGWCIQDEEDARPSIRQVVQILEGIVDVTTPPIPISFAVLAEVQTT